MKAPLDLILDDGAKIGTFSRVFLDHENNLAYKLFKSVRFGEVLGVQDGEPLANGKRRAIFDAELEAFRIANNTDELRPYVPKLFGTCAVRSIRDIGGNDLSAGFLLDQCYELKLLRGEDRKFDCESSKAQIPAWDEIKEKFARHGIHFICDASFFLMPDGTRPVNRPGNSERTNCRASQAGDQPAVPLSLIVTPSPLCRQAPSWGKRPRLPGRRQARPLALR